MEPKTLTGLLDKFSDSAVHGITFYPPSERTSRNSRLLLNIDGVQSGSILLLHFDHHIDHITWLWSALYAGCTPAMSLALPKNLADCERHIKHLSLLLENHVCLTRSGLLPSLAKDVLKVVEVDTMLSNPHIRGCGDCSTSTAPHSSDPALLMLTSGSTGHSKAVGLSHGQILASLSGKSATMPVDSGTSFLNWIRLDHVGSLVEIHLHALYSGASQVHVQPEDIVSNPAWFLEVLHRHNVGMTFAPNFFLADLQRYLQSPPDDLGALDLRSLRYIVSGGEANDTKTCARLSSQLARYCPEYDVELQNEVTTLGECIPGLTMHVVPSDDGRSLEDGKVGELQLRGKVVFSSYYNDEAAMAKSFTADGWFKTGDSAVIDSKGKLQLMGRSNELISVNGIKYSLREIEAAIEDADIEGVRTGSVRCFSYRPPESATDIVGVTYQPRYAVHDAHRRYEAMNVIVQRVLLHANCRPYVLPLDPAVVDHSALGKVSRAKPSQNLREGKYDEEVEANAKVLAEGEPSDYTAPQSGLEETVLQEWADVIDLPAHVLGVQRNMFEAGLTSIEIIKLQQMLSQNLKLPIPIPTHTLLTNPTVRSLAAALQHRAAPGTYTPVVVLQSLGNKTPLWLIHPAAGEALVFLELSRYITQRPVYGLRTRGFHPGEERFGSLSECVATYHAAIKQQQPHGASRSICNCWLAKVLEHEGDEVRFLASLNRRHLIPENRFNAFRKELKDLPHDEAVDRVMKVASAGRLRELSLDAPQLEAWADVTLGLQDIARQYQPSGRVRQMDVFHCEPLAVVDCDKSEWFGRLQRWQEFVDSDIRYHHAEGHHHDMIGPKNAYSLQRTLRQALFDRGL
ncbi:hypothetical protein BJX96DRAFT_186496 [Aspergillus floccosus]